MARMKRAMTIEWKTKTASERFGAVFFFSEDLPLPLREAHQKGEVVSAGEGDLLGAERKLKPEGGIQ
jgi:hypothetical protein